MRKYVNGGGEEMKYNSLSFNLKPQWPFGWNHPEFPKPSCREWTDDREWAEDRSR